MPIDGNGDSAYMLRIAAAIRRGNHARGDRKMFIAYKSEIPPARGVEIARAAYEELRRLGAPRA